MLLPNKKEMWMQKWEIESPPAAADDLCNLKYTIR